MELRGLLGHRASKPLYFELNYVGYHKRLTNPKAAFLPLRHGEHGGFFSKEGCYLY